MRRLTAVLLCSILSPVWCGDLVHRNPERALKNNPLAGNQEAEKAGAKLYARECSACHGLNREGKRSAPPLNVAEVYQAAPGGLFSILRNGSLRRGMPSFAHLPEVQRWQIVTFLKSSSK